MLVVTVLDFDDNEKYQPVYEGRRRVTPSPSTSRPSPIRKVTLPPRHRDLRFVPEGQPALSLAQPSTRMAPSPWLFRIMATNGQKIDVPVRVTYEDGTLTTSPPPLRYAPITTATATRIRSILSTCAAGHDLRPDTLHQQR